MGVMLPMMEVCSIFLVNEDLSARSGLSRLLRAAGHDVHVFASANEFLNALDSGVTGCLVLDPRMPVPLCEEVYAELRERGISMPVIVVSADDDHVTRQKAQQLDAVAFFRKPVDGAALLDAIDWAMR